MVKESVECLCGCHWTQIDKAADDLTVRLRENGHAVDELDDRALLLNVLTKHFNTASHKFKCCNACPKCTLRVRIGYMDQHANECDV